MPQRLKAFIQYLAIISATIFLIWFSLRGLNPGKDQNTWEYLLATWEKANKWWLLVMGLIAVLSHFIRAVRWKMLIVPANYSTTVSHSFYSIMVGYLVNLVIPRGGEVSRCYNLYKLDKVPVDVSFGTVVVERVVDLICFVLLLLVVFFIEATKLFAFLDSFLVGRENKGNVQWIVYLAIAGIVCLLIFYLIFKKSTKVKIFIQKTWQGVKKGLFTIFRLENKGLFIFYSLFIWFLYFLMSYAVMFAFPATESLGLNAVLSLFAIGSLAMTIPLPGGAGSYHTLVPAGLVFLYQVPQTDAVAFTFIFHGWQTLIMIAGGAISLLITSVIVKRKKSTEQKVHGSR